VSCDNPIDGAIIGIYFLNEMEEQMTRIEHNLKVSEDRKKIYVDKKKVFIDFKASN
jgi:hypothetical protein